jgi:N-glycosylase/DNA lyase
MKQFLTFTDFSETAFDPNITFGSGQTFRWKKQALAEESFWTGVVANQVIRVKNNEAECIASLKDYNSKQADFSELVFRYFSFQDNLEEIHSSFPRDQYLLNAVRRFPGLRVLTQDPWECLVSFVCSINKNIPSIKMMIESLSIKFGRKIDHSADDAFYSFPEPAILASASKNDLLSCKVGFRWKFIKFLARQVSSGKLDLDSLAEHPYELARNKLVSELSGTTFGVGPKVADCVMLFSMHKLDAFPVDVWILRCIKDNYSEKMHLSSQLDKSLSIRIHDLIHDRAYEYFGKYCGYAQQYLYVKTRSEFIRNKGPA